MSGSLPAFQLASDLGPSLSREAELEDLCSRQARELERFRTVADGLAPQPRPTSPEIKTDGGADLKSICKDIERLKKENSDLKKALDEAQSDIHWIQECFPKLIAEDRKRLATIESQTTFAPQRKQIHQGELLVSLLVANGGKMLAIDARHKLGISKPAFSLLLRTMSDKIELKHFHLDRRKNVIILKS